MTVQHELEITFGDADPAGIAYYPRILDFCHRAFEAFFEKAVGEPYATTFLTHNIGYPTVALSAEFGAPMRFGERIVVSVSIEKVTTKSVTFVYAFRRAKDGVLCATVRNIAASTSRETFRAVPIPERHARAFRGHLIANPKNP